MSIQRLILILICYTIALINFINCYKVIYAVNAGGDEFVDSNGIKYEKDRLSVGTSSEYGKSLLMIGRVKQKDEILYQTERYHTSTFGYEIPIEGDGDYLLILKFCEVYFNSPNMKVFDVVLNGDHTILADLDIFGLVGRGNAHEEYVYFSVSRGRLYYKEEESEIRGGKIRIEFIKGYRDNPKINAIVLIKGDINNINIPRLPPLSIDPEVETNSDNSDSFELPVEEVEPIPNTVNKQRKTSGPKQPDPYSENDNSIMISIFIGIVAFIPLLFCLCRL